jgi:hypothetical protein
MSEPPSHCAHIGVVNRPLRMVAYPSKLCNFFLPFLQMGRLGPRRSRSLAELDRDWHTVSDAVVAQGSAVIHDPDCVGSISALGLRRDVVSAGEEGAVVRSSAQRSLMSAPTTMPSFGCGPWLLCGRAHPVARGSTRRLARPHPYGFGSRYSCVLGNDRCLCG